MLSEQQKETPKNFKIFLVLAILLLLVSSFGGSVAFAQGSEAEKPLFNRIFDTVIQLAFPFSGIFSIDQLPNQRLNQLESLINELKKDSIAPKTKTGVTTLEVTPQALTVLSPGTTYVDLIGHTTIDSYGDVYPSSTALTSNSKPSLGIATNRYYGIYANNFTVPTGGLDGGILKADASGLLSTTDNIGLDSSDVGGTLRTGNGGTGISSYTAGDLLYANADRTLTTLSIGTNTQVLTVSSGLPAWSAAVGGGGGVTSATGTADQVLVNGVTTAQTGAVTFSLPQSINTTSSPSFAGITLAGTVSINDSATTNTTSIAGGTTTGAVTIGGTGVLTINMGAGGTGAKTIQIGDGASTGTTTIESGSGGITLNPSINNPVTINGGTSTGTVTVGGTGVQTISIGNGGTGAKTINIGDGASTGATDIESGTGNLSLGISNAARTIVIGTATAATSNTVNINNTTNAGSVNIGAGMTTGTITIGGTGAQTGTITIGGGTGTQTVSLGTGGTGVKTVNLGTGTAANVISIGTGQTAGSVSIGTAMTTGTISIGGTGAQTGTITFGGGTGAQTVNLGTGGTGVKTVHVGDGAAANLVTVGSITGAASLTLNSGTGNITLVPTGTAAIIKNNTVKSVVLANAALGTTATEGFVYIPSSAGIPTGVPAAQTGVMAMEYDTTNNKLMVYNSTGTPAWKGAVFADYAEWAPAAGANIGDVVTLTDKPNTINDPDAPFMLGQTTDSYDRKVVGVVSKYAEEANMANGYKKSPDYHAIALVGRVPVNVSTENGSIVKGDYLTSSSVPGVAMGATKAGVMIGKAMEAYSGNGTGKIMAYIQVGYHDPNSSVDTSGSLSMRTVKGLLVDGALTVSGPAEFKSDTIFDALVTFISNVIFRGDVSFFGRPTFNRDTAGLGVVKQGADSVNITFEREYAQIPFVNVTPTMYEGNDGAGNSLLNGDVHYVIQNLSTRGFTIKLNKPAPADLNFSWTALAVNNANQFSSTSVLITPQSTTSPEVLGSTPTPTPTPTETPTPEASSAPSDSGLQSPSPEASIIPLAN